ncbi:lipid IV(A) 3-deoxy-D-manno-octulosonic acid transferase [Candidatus Spongiihabitans sp.]|uniref:lipid IV(A) 3-deoxy-D-manno-octulosonic acid transferase n=1 Tax=Candidatus Spongiihabitans sp. TaxID=3101308 RepID=UPI003C7C9969
MLTLYRIVLYFALPVVMIRLLYRTSRNKQYLTKISQRFGFNLLLPKVKHNSTKDDAYSDGIWIHAVSVGEVNAAVPLVKNLLASFPGKAITITTMTPTGSDRVLKVFGESVQHCYLPYDYPGAVKRFLNVLRPQLAMVMETEIWPNLINECHNRQIPMIYTNVRLSSRSHKGYLRFKKLFAPTLKKVSQFAVQAKADAERLINIGANADTVEVTGSIKFEMTLPASVMEAAQSVRRDLGWERPVWVAGSTHEGEESQVIDAYLKARKEIENLLLVLVPRHPERFSAVFKLATGYGCKTVLRSQSNTGIPQDTEIYVADTMGELTLLIAAGDVAFIGGSLAPAGGHNVLEACAAGVAAIFGPHMFNFQEISDLVLAKGAGIQIMNSDELCEVVVKLLNDPVIRDQYGSAGRELIGENKGALDKICAMVDRCGLI